MHLSRVMECSELLVHVSGVGTCNLTTNYADRGCVIMLTDYNADGWKMCLENRVYIMTLRSPSTFLPFLLSIIWAHFYARCCRISS
jgi:hypothetical protein